MPVFLELANLIFEKELLNKKYQGGCAQFRIDWKIPDSEVNQEDDELISIASMNLDEFEIDKLVRLGLEFDADKQFSNDFVAVSRYGGASWEVDWLECNESFAWHPNCLPEQKTRAKYLSEEIPLDEIFDLLDQGIEVFKTIK